LAPMQLGFRLLICIGGFLATTTSSIVTTKETNGPDDDMFIATLVEKFQAFGDGAGPITCPQFEYPILVPPTQSYLMVTENRYNEPISYKKKRYSPFFFMRPTSPTPKSETPWSYRYNEAKAEANFINTNEGDSTQLADSAEKIRTKRYSPMLRVWKHQLGDVGIGQDDNGIDKRYTPFLNFWKNGEKNALTSSNGHGEYDFNQILEVLRRIREWKQQNAYQPSNQGIKKFTKRYAPFSRVFNKNQDFKKRYTPFIHFWKDQQNNGQKSPKRFEEQDLNPVFEDILSSLEDRVNVKRPFELVTILQNGQICFSGRNLGVRVPKNNPEQLPYYMALLGRMVDSICPASKGCILQG